MRRNVALLVRDYRIDPDTVEAMTLSRMFGYCKLFNDLEKERP